MIADQKIPGTRHGIGSASLSSQRKESVFLANNLCAYLGHSLLA
jgi:hypothetical protein